MSQGKCSGSACRLYICSVQTCRCFDLYPHIVQIHVEALVPCLSSCVGFFLIMNDKTSSALHKVSVGSVRWNSPVIQEQEKLNTSIFPGFDSNFDLDKSFCIASFGTGTLHLQMSKLWMIIVDMLVEAEQVSVHFRTRWTVNGFSFHVMDSYMSFDIGYEFWEVTTNATRPKSASGINCLLHEIQHTWNDQKSKICIFKTSSKWTNKIFVKCLGNLSKK